MKRILFLGLAAMLIFSSCKEKNGVTISGVIQNYDQTPLQIYDVYGKSSWTDNVIVENGKFEKYLPIDKPVIKMILYGSGLKNIFLQPGETLEISFDAAKMDSTLRFGGSLAVENSVLDSVTGRLNRLDFDYLFAQPLETVAGYLDSTSNADRQYFEKLISNKKTTPVFREYTLALIDYNSAYIRIYLGDYKEKRPEDYYDFLNQLTLENNNLLDIPQYRIFLAQYIDMKAKRRFSVLDTIKKRAPDAHFDESLQVIANLKNENIRAYSLFNVLNERLMDKGLNGFDKYYDYFQKNNTDSAYARQLRIEYEKKQQIAPGQPAPPFTLVDKNGQQVSLNDFKGKYVYIDFWLTTCPRSARQLPYWLKLNSDYKDDNVAFVSISVDEDKTMWLNYVKEKKNVGTNLWSDKFWDSEVFKDYQVYGTPTYVLIDKEGNIIDPVAAMPSSTEIRETFNRILKSN